MTHPIRLLVLADEHNARVRHAWDKLEPVLAEAPNVEVVAVHKTEEFQVDDCETDLVVVLGGDGSMLRACRQQKNQQKPTVGINLGRLGFLADLSPEEFEDNLSVFVNREFTIVEHLMFECDHQHADGSVDRYIGLNEVAVSSAGSLRILDVDLDIDGERVTTYSCDGLIISTPVGSTAHSLSAGGPILRQNLSAFVITPICPHTLTNRPIVDSADCTYTLSVPEPPDGTMMVIDGQIKRPMLEGDTIRVKRATATFQLARIPGHSYYATLRRKLGWGGQLKLRPRSPSSGISNPTAISHDRQQPKK